jgi:hypothetical protein
MYFISALTLAYMFTLEGRLSLCTEHAYAEQMRRIWRRLGHLHEAEQTETLTMDGQMAPNAHAPATANH